MSYFFSILAAIVVLGILIIVHEVGHYLAGRLLKLPVVEFAIGMGPKLFGFTRKGIDYTIRLLPLGGFCAFNGEDDPDAHDEALLDPARSDIPPEWRNLNNCPPWRRLVMQFSGSAMNLLTAYLCAVLLLCAVGLPVSQSLIASVEPGSPAAEAGIQKGDYILAVNGSEEASLTEVIQSGSGEPVELLLERRKGTVTVQVSPRYFEDTRNMRIGVSMGLRYEPLSISEGFSMGASFCLDIGKEMISLLRNMIFKGEGVGDVMGVVGTVNYMASETSSYFQMGMRSGMFMVLQLAILLALNLGIINLVPLPALDGGRIIFTLIELIFRRPVPRRAEAWIHTAGFVVLMGLMVVLFFKDIVTLLGIGGAA